MAETLKLEELAKSAGRQETAGRETVSPLNEQLEVLVAGSPSPTTTRLNTFTHQIIEIIRSHSNTKCRRPWFPQPHRPTVSANGLEYGVS